MFHMPHMGGAPAGSGGFGSHPDDARLHVLEHELNTLKMQRSQQQMAIQPVSPMSTQMAPMGAPMGAMVPVASRTNEHSELLQVHKEMLQHLAQSQVRHTELLSAHTTLMTAHQKLLAEFSTQAARQGGSAAGVKKLAMKPPCLGVVRLDYDYPPAAGDTDCPASFGYDVTYRVCPGLTFEIAQAGRFTEKVERAFADAIKYQIGRAHV